MNTGFKLFLSMSFSGSVLILALFFGKRFLQDKISRQWQYYIWLIVILRLLFPFGPEINLLGKIYQAADRAITQADMPSQQPSLHTSGGVSASTDDLPRNSENTDSRTEDLTSYKKLRDIRTLVMNHMWLFWLVAASGMLIRKITFYQGFVRYIRAGLTPVSDIGILDRLSIAAESVGMKRPIELYTNPLVSSPLLLGFFRPCIVLPGVDIPEKDFHYIVMHELVHYRRRDIYYKWLVQAVVCLHWFNPLVYLMSREITRACEFSCDEAVLVKAGCDNAQDYGETLLNAMAAIGKYRENFGAVTLSANKQLLKERLGAIMGFRKKSGRIRAFTGVLTLCVIFGASFIGVYPVAAATDQLPGSHSVPEANDKYTFSDRTGTTAFPPVGERYYEAGSLPLFQIMFARMDEEAQTEWFDRIYADRDIVHAATAASMLDEDCALLQRFARKAYEDGDAGFFSAMIMHMSEEMLELWLDKALEDGNQAFQSILFNALDRDNEFDELKEKQEKEWAEAQKAEYQAAGVIVNGKNYYYQGQLVNIFLDIRANKSFYTLNMNPAGTVNIRVVRGEDGKITGVFYMTDAEVVELLGDKDDLDEG